MYRNFHPQFNDFGQAWSDGFHASGNYPHYYEMLQPESRNLARGNFSSGSNYLDNSGRHHNKSRKHISVLNFQKYAEEGNRFINEICYELNTDNRNKAARILRAVLHALRDRIPPDDAVEFAQGLPMAIKGVYFDQYDISGTPVIIRTKNGFIDFIREKDGYSDFSSPDEVVLGLQAVFRVLERHMDWGQINQLKNQLNMDIVDLIEADLYY